MKKILTTIILAFSVFAISPWAWAQDNCPFDDCTKFNRMGLDNEKIAIWYENELREFENRNTRYLNNTTPGFNFNFSLGYSVIAAADISIALGYDIVFNEKRNVGFGIYVDAHGMIGYPFGFNASLMPSVLLTKGTFRFRFGLGIGDFTVWDETSEYGGEYDMKSFFMFKPTLKFDWLVTQKMFVGFGFDFPIIIKMGFLEKYASSPWFGLYFNIGYKN